MILHRRRNTVSDVNKSEYACTNQSLEAKKLGSTIALVYRMV